jgi:protein associated with RNAse G/E
MAAMSMQAGDRVQVEAVALNQVVTISPAGHRVEGLEGGWASRHTIRAFYWGDRPYSLLEAYAPDGRLEEIYVNIGSPAEFGETGIRFTDHELDVSRRPPDAARIVDQDEFRVAAAAYGYSPAFQASCHQVAREAVALADGWVARGMPAFDAAAPE